MRLAVLADIHGNLTALQAILSDVQTRGVDGYIVAGDHVNGGPRPVEVMRALRTLNAWMIRGNTDNYLLQIRDGTAPDAWRTSKQWAVTRWSYQHIDAETLDYIAALPEQCTVELAGVAPIRVVHGTPSSAFDHSIPDDDPTTMDLFRIAGIIKRKRVLTSVNQILAEIAESVLVCSHSHISWLHHSHGRLALNPGSVGFPINGDARAQYALLTWQDNGWHADLKAVAYDLARNRKDFVDSGLLEEGGGLARSFLIDAEMGRNSAGILLAHAYDLAAQAGFSDCKIVPNEIWDRAVATFDWQAAGQ